MPRYRQDDLRRPPTQLERWVGFSLATVVAVLCLGVSWAILRTEEDPSSPHKLAAIVFFAALGLAGVFFALRAALTQPQVASSSLHRTYAWAAVTLTSLLLAGSLVSGAELRKTVLAAALFFVALGYVLRRRKTPSNKSLERTREG